MQKNNINKIYKKYLSVSEDNCKKWSKDFFTNFFCNKNVFFFSSKIESGGYLIARKIFDEFEVLSLATNRKERRKGIASELLRSLFKKAEQEKAKKILLEVSKKNIPAIKMYETICEKRLAIAELNNRWERFEKTNTVKEAQ